MAAQLFTIPSTDTAFRTFVQRTLAKMPTGSPEAFERRLRRTYPRALVRERDLAGEVPSWYVYRDGAWRVADDDAWWEHDDVPRVTVSADGWIEGATSTARGLLGIAAGDTEPRHFTDFVVPGAVDDAVELFQIARAARTFEATIALRPTSGDTIAVDIRVTPHGDGLAAAFRLARDVDMPPATSATSLPARIEYLPPTDVAFRAYAVRALARMPEPAPDGLALRLRRLYPHAHVERAADGWLVVRDRDHDNGSDRWWLADGLPLVRYDRMALILEANPAAERLFGRAMAGHHWQEFVTPGSTDEVGVMLDILAEAGAAESRFRMPRGDGSLLEFDSYTVVEGDGFSTVFRPVPGAATPA